MSTINKKPTSNHLALLFSIKRKIEQHQIEVKTIKKNIEISTILTLIKLLNLNRIISSENKIKNNSKVTMNIYETFKKLFYCYIV